MSEPTRAILGTFENVIESFEAAMAERGEADVRDFLPDRSAADYVALLQELVRVDLELRSTGGEVRSLEVYRQNFPELFEHPVTLQPLAYEEYRLRMRAGFSVDAEEYARRYCVDTSAWCPAAPHQNDGDTGRESAAALRNPADWLPGSSFLDFQIIGELGRGTFSRVYLARQGSLAGRCVVLKVSSAQLAESDRLARLQHTNIVPIYSVHSAGSASAICMPYFGAATLRHLMQALRERPLRTASGEDFLDTAAALDADILRSLVRSEHTVCSDSRPGNCHSGDAEPAGPQAAGHSALRGLGHESASLWLVRQLAEGLSHAHARGILHRDLKPANVLLTSEGQPMILDFNLACEASAWPAANAIVGGTLPYMSPEQLAALESFRSVDQRSDLFSLGVILFELLTFELPFPSDNVPIREMVEIRWKPLHGPSRIRPDISPGADAIVRKCLMPDPQDRYATAENLMEDLNRQLSHLPLRHAPNRSLRERFQKWVRRHPGMTSASGVLTLSCLVVAVLLIAGVNLNDRFQRIRAKQAFLEFQAEVPRVRTDAYAAVLGDISPGVACDRLRRVLEQYTSGRPAVRWQDSADVSRLSEADLINLGETVQELQFLLSHLDSIVTQGSVSLAVQTQNQARDRRTTAAWDRYLTATKAVMSRRFLQAAEILGPLCDDHPDNSAMAFLYGISLRGIQDLRRAEVVFSACIALNPVTVQHWYQRGVCRLAARDYENAIRDFTRVLQIQPDMTAALVSRGIAASEVGESQKSLDDLNHALRLGFPETRIYFIRASVQQALSNPAAAAEDIRKGMELEPSDPRSWVARGLQRLPGDPAAALADFEAARAMDSESHDALRNIAMVLSEYLHRPDDAIEVLTEATRSHPQDPFLWAGRGVLLARAGQRRHALDDASRAAALSREPLIIYMTGCISALSSQPATDDFREALVRLAESFRLDSRLAAMAQHDPDLALIRESPEFAALISASAVLAPESIQRR